MPLRRSRPSDSTQKKSSIFVTEIVIADGAELKERLDQEGLDAGEIVFKYLWPRFGPPPGSGIRSIVKSDHLRQQFDRLVDMHQIAQSSVPMPLAIVLSPERELVGYALEYVEGVTLRQLVDSGMLEEAARQLELVRGAIAKLHARAVPHGDLNASNIIAADDGRTVLIDPVPYPKPQMLLQDELSLEELGRLIEA